MIEAALGYLLRGWAPIPVPHRSKNPGFDDWGLLRLTRDTAHQYFNGKPQNIGILLGQPSNWLIDVDLDHKRAVELAPQFLPPTPAKFGRPGKPLSHWIYRATCPVATRKFKSKTAGNACRIPFDGSADGVPTQHARIRRTDHVGY